MKNIFFLISLACIGTSLMCADTLLGVGGYFGLTVAHIDTVTGNSTIINHLNTGVYTQSLTYDPTDNTFYSITNLGSSLGLYQIDPVSGVFHLVAPVSVPSSLPNISAVAASPQGGSLYASDNQTLYTVNKQTGAFTTISPLNVGYVRSLAFAPDGTLCGYTRYGDGENGPLGVGFFKVDPTTGKTTVLTPSGTIPELCNEGLAFAPDGTLYGAEQNAIVRLDPATGQAEAGTRVFLSSFPSPLNGIAYLGGAAATPEPSTFVLLGIGVFCLLCAVRHQRRLRQVPA